MDKEQSFECKIGHQDIRIIHEDIFTKRFKNELAFEQLEGLVQTGYHVYYNPLKHTDHLGRDKDRIYSYGFCIALSREKLDVALSSVYETAQEWMKIVFPQRLN